MTASASASTSGPGAPGSQDPPERSCASRPWASRQDQNGSRSVRPSRAGRVNRITPSQVTITDRRLRRRSTGDTGPDDDAARAPGGPADANDRGKSSMMFWPAVTLLGFLVLTGLVIAMGASSTARYEREQRAASAPRPLQSAPASRCRPPSPPDLRRPGRHRTQRAPPLLPEPRGAGVSRARPRRCPGRSGPATPAGRGACAPSAARSGGRSARPPACPRRSRRSRPASPGPAPATASATTTWPAASR